MTTAYRSPVTAAEAAAPEVAVRHFATRLALETDADDVAAAIRDRVVDFTVVDVRSEEAFSAGHLPGAVNLPHALLTAETMAASRRAWSSSTAGGPGCNGATKGAAKLAAHGRRVKEMLGGLEYYAREDHPVEGHAADAGLYERDESGLVTLPSRISCGC